MINYPLSSSNSYIVFSDKDPSLASTNKLYNSNLFSNRNQANEEAVYNFNKSKKEGQLYQNEPLIETGKIPIKLIQIRMQHAATIIQKHWKGYLTRKLLSECIRAEEPKLISTLEDLKSKKIGRNS